MKILRPELLSDPAAVAGFLQERSILTSIDSPNLVRVLDLVLDDEKLAIVMEYVEGEDLRRYLHRVGTVPPAEAVRLASQLLQGVAVIHEAGIVHRDIKPETFLLDTSNGAPVVKLTDLGVALTLHDTHITRVSKVVGTPHYMAPEVASGGGVSPAADIYSVGIVLYEMLAGRPPFTASNPLTVLMQHSRDPVPPIPGLREDLSTLIHAISPAECRRRLR